MCWIFLSLPSSSDIDSIKRPPEERPSYQAKYSRWKACYPSRFACYHLCESWSHKILHTVIACVEHNRTQNVDEYMDASIQTSRSQTWAFERGNTSIAVYIVTIEKTWFAYHKWDEYPKIKNENCDEAWRSSHDVETPTTEPFVQRWIFDLDSLVVCFLSRNVPLYYQIRFCLNETSSQPTQ